MEKITEARFDGLGIAIAVPSKLKRQKKEREEKYKRAMG